jgi:NitT/TauT family transport system substrate-binding protein
MKTTIRTFATVAAAALVLAGCGGGDDNASESSTDGGDDGALREITVSAIPIADTAALWLGVEQGFFEEEGLDVEITTTGGGAEAMANVVSGDVEFAFGNVISVMIAIEQGLDVRYVSNGTSASGTEGGFGALVVPADSDVESPADLEGGLVSVNNFSNIVAVTAQYSVEQAGGDQSLIEWVEIPFPDAPAALEQGEIDAAMIVEPFVTQAVDAGNRVIAWPFQEIENLDIAGYFATNAQIEDDPELTEAFTTAMHRSLEYSEENPDEVRRIIATYTEIPEEMLARIALPNYRVEWNRESLQELADATLEYGVVSEPVDLDALLPVELSDARAVGHPTARPHPLHQPRTRGRT